MKSKHAKSPRCGARVRRSVDSSLLPVDISQSSVDTSPLSVDIGPLSVDISPLSVDISPLSMATRPLSVDTGPLSVDTGQMSAAPRPLYSADRPLENATCTHTADGGLRQLSHQQHSFTHPQNAECRSKREEGLVAKQTEAAERPQVHPRHADYDCLSRNDR